MPLIPLTVAFALGIFLGSLLWMHPPFACSTALFPVLHAGPWAHYFVALLVVGLAPVVYFRRRGHVRYALYGVYVGLGVLLYLARPLSPCLSRTHVGTLAARLGEKGKTVTVTGVIAGWPDVRAYRTFYRLRVQGRSTYSGETPLDGDVLLQAPRYPAYQYGDRVRVVGILQQPPVFDTFDYRSYLARKGMHALLRADRVIPLDAGHGHVFWRWLYRVRAYAGHIIDRTLPEPYAALSNGILLGIESGIPRALYDDFNATGTSHIIVISGFNIAIIAGLLLALLVPLLGERRAGVVALVGIALYVLFVGADAAVVRAGLMGMVYAGSRVVRRQGHVLNTLTVSALLMLLLNPLTLWDLGFQLSFLATLGLIVLHPALERPVRHWFSQILPGQWQDRLLDVLNESVIVTLAAQLATTPLIMAVFGRVSLISLLTNALILPVQPLVMIGAGVSTVAGMLWLPLGQLLALIPLLPLAWTVAVVRKTATWPGAAMDTPSWVRTAVLVYYGAFALYVALYYRALTQGHPFHLLGGIRTRLPDGVFRRVRPLRLALIVPIIVGGLLFGNSLLPAANNMRVTLLPGGEVRVRTTQGLTMIVPAGESGLAATSTAPNQIWILVDMRPSQLAALRIRAQEARPALVVYPQACFSNPSCARPLGLFLQALDNHHIPRTGLSPTQTFHLGTLARVRYLEGGAGFAYPITVEEGQARVLLPANIPVAVQSTLDVTQASGSVWPLPLPQGGTWPLASFVTRLEPALLLYPEGVTYPPAVGDTLASYPLRRYLPESYLILSLETDPAH